MEEWNDCEELKPESKETWSFVNKNEQETKHRTEWCAGTRKHRCMRCGRGSKDTKLQEKRGHKMWRDGASGIWENMT